MYDLTDQIIRLKPSGRSFDSLCFLQVLASDEGRELRARQQENVRYIRDKLVEAGIPAMHSPSHIIPIHVGTLL